MNFEKGQITSATFIINRHQQLQFFIFATIKKKYLDGILLCSIKQNLQMIRSLNFVDYLPKIRMQRLKTFFGHITKASIFAHKSLQML